MQRQKPKNRPQNSIVDDYVLERIDYRARRLAIQFDLSDEQRGDYRQSMILEVLNAFRNFNPEKANRQTFINRVLDRHFKHIVRGEINQRRHPSRAAMSLDEVTEGFHPLVNNPRQGELSETGRVELKMDIKKIMAAMPPRLRRICDYLKEYSPCETAEKLGISRTAIYRNINEIREFFADAGYDFSDFSATDSR